MFTLALCKFEPVLGLFALQCHMRNVSTNFMRHTVIILALIFIKLINGYSQSIDSSNVYIQALTQHSRYHNDERINSNDKSSKSLKIYIEKDDYTTNYFPNQINNFKIEILDKKDLKTKTKGKNSIYLIAIRPARWEKGKLIIAVIDYHVTRKRNHFYYGNSGGSLFQIIPDKNGSLKICKIHQEGP